MESTIYLALGSNQGDRHALLDSAISHLSESVGQVVATSQRYETEPVGFVSSAIFVNMVVSVRTSLEPMAVLDATQAIERALGRVSKSHDGIHYDRPIDIDLLLWEGQTLEGERLTLPHPRLQDRLFVLDPMCDLAPELRHPVLGLTMVELRQRLLKA